MITHSIQGNSFSVNLVTLFIGTNLFMGPLFLDHDLHERGVGGLFHISMLRVNMRKKRSVATFRLFDGLPPCFARDLGARLRSGEIAEEAVNKGLVVIDHREQMASAG